MELMTESWTDRHLDDLSRKVDHGFALVDHRFERVDEQFERVDERFEQMDRRFRRVDEQFREVGRRFEEVDERLARMEVRLDKVDGRFESMHKEMTLGFREVEREAARRHAALLLEMSARFESQDQKMIYGIVGLVGALMTGFAGVMAVIATQL